MLPVTGGSSEGMSGQCEGGAKIKDPTCMEFHHGPKGTRYDSYRQS